MIKVVTKIEIKDKKVLIDINDEYYTYLFTRDIRKVKFKAIIQEEHELTDEDLEVIVKHVITRGKRRIMHLLGKMDYPKAKLEARLAKDGYIDEHIAIILESFVEKGFINDVNLVNRRVETFRANKSIKEIRFKMRSQGFTKEDINEAINDKFNEGDELESAIKLLNKKFVLKRLRLEEHELKKKALGFLARKGYPINICFKAFDTFMEESTLNDEEW